jgi:alpha-L-rhamnosidase
MTTTRPARVWAEVTGRDALGHGQQPALCWWLPGESSVQHAYRLRTDDGYDTGRVEGAIQSFVRLPVFDRSRRSALAQVKVWTDLGESAWSDPVRLESGLLGEQDWQARWIGVEEAERPEKGSRPAYWLRTLIDVPPAAEARLYLTALGLYEAFLDGTRVGDTELAPGYTQYRARVQYQAYDITSLARPGRHVLAVLLADGWYRGQVGLLRSANQYGGDVALRAQLEVRTGTGWQVAAASQPGWRTAPSHITAADLIGGQREDRRRLADAVHDLSFDDRTWREAVARDVDVAIVRSVAPPVRRVQEIRPATVRPVHGPGHGTDAFVVDFGQNFSGWVRLERPAGGRVTLTHGEWLDRDGDLTTGHLDVDLPIFPERLPLGQVDEVVSAGNGDVFEPRFTTHGFRYVRIQGQPGPFGPNDITGVVVHSDLRRLGWFSCSDDRVSRLHEAVVWSLRSNMCDIPTDCPQRERAGWTGDWQIFAPTAAYLYDVLAFTRKWLGDVALDQRADGCVANISPCPPAEGFDGRLGALHGSAGWGDVVVSAPWDLYQAYGDTSLLRETWGIMTAWAGFAADAAAGGRHPDRAAARPEPAAHERYLWDTGFHWGEWLEPGGAPGDFGAFARADKSEVATAYLHRSAATVVRVAEVLGLPEERWRRYRDVAAGALDAWRREFVRPDGTLAVPTQASHVRALAFGLVPEELRPSVAARLAELVGLAGGHLTTGFLSTPYLLPVLADHGYLDTAYELLLQDTPPSWLTMVERGSTTMWEEWEGVDGRGAPHASLNHYNKGAVASFLHRYVAGLRPAQPGYRRFDVRPRPGGGITSATARHISPFGPIEVSWRREGRSMELDVLVPPGTTATVTLPGEAPCDAPPGHHRWTSAAPVAIP